MNKAFISRRFLILNYLTNINATYYYFTLTSIISLSLSLCVEANPRENKNGNNPNNKEEEATDVPLIEGFPPSLNQATGRG